MKKVRVIAILFSLILSSCLLTPPRPKVEVEYFNLVKKEALPINNTKFSILLPEDEVDPSFKKVADFQFSTYYFPNFIYESFVENSLENGANLFHFDSIRVDVGERSRIFWMRGAIYRVKNEVIDKNLERQSSLDNDDKIKMILYNMGWEHKHFFANKKWYDLLWNGNKITNLKRTRYEEIVLDTPTDTVKISSPHLKFYKANFEPGSINYFEVEFVPDRYLVNSSRNMGRGFGGGGVSIDLSGGPQFQDREGNYHFRSVYNDKPRKYYLDWKGINRGRFESAMTKLVGPIEVDPNYETNILD